MTQEEFIKILDEKGYTYNIEDDRIIVTGVYIDLSSLTSLPSGIQFNNSDDVDLYSLTTIPSAVNFRNKGDVYLYSLESISPGVEFKNGGSRVDLESLTGGLFKDWSGNIEGIDSKRLLNSMINKKIFER